MFTRSSRDQCPTSKYQEIASVELRLLVAEKWVNSDLKNVEKDIERC
jgi:hypothetical protein